MGWAFFLVLCRHARNKPTSDSFRGCSYTHSILSYSMQWSDRPSWNNLYNHYKLIWVYSVLSPLWLSFSNNWLGFCVRSWLCLKDWWSQCYTPCSVLEQHCSVWPSLGNIKIGHVKHSSKCPMLGVFRWGNIPINALVSLVSPGINIYCIWDNCTAHNLYPPPTFSASSCRVLLMWWK